MRRIALAIFATLLVSIPFAAARAQEPAPTAPTIAPAGLSGIWHGAIELPTGELAVEVELAEAAAGWTGTIDIPVQGAKGLKLEPVTVERGRVKFTIAGVPGSPTFDGQLGDGEISGTFTQGAASLPFRLTPGPLPAGAPGTGNEPIPPATPTDVSAFEGHWEGAIQLPNGELQVRIDLGEQGGAWTGTIDIPVQGVTGAPLGGIAVGGGQARFKIQGVPGDPTFRGKLDDGRIAGTFTQGGTTFPFRLGREKVATPKRPQEPQPPFPYENEEVTYTSGGVKLAGTLTLPEGEGPFPAALLLTGSGAQDRDEALFGHRPFAVLADHLARHGIATLRVDDRGVGGSTGDLGQTTLQELAQDALAGVGFLRGRPEVAKGRVGLVGHSEGALVAAIAANRSENVAFAVLLAGPGVPGHEILVRQGELLLKAQGVTGDDLKEFQKLQSAAIDLVRQGKQGPEAEAEARRLARGQLELLTKNQPMAAGDLDAAAEQAAKPLFTPWFRSFVAYDPRPDLRAIGVPVLAINGALDLQVDPGQNLPAIEKALKEGGNPDVTVRRLEGLNHLLQPATTGAMDEYGRIETTIAPEALELVSGWLRERFAK